MDVSLCACLQLLGLFVSVLLCCINVLASAQSRYMAAPSTPVDARLDRSDELRQTKRKLKAAEREIARLQRELGRGCPEVTATMHGSGYIQILRLCCCMCEKGLELPLHGSHVV